MGSSTIIRIEHCHVFDFHRSTHLPTCLPTYCSDDPWDKKTEALSWLYSSACFHAWSRQCERRGLARQNNNFTQCCLRQRNTPTTTLSHLKRFQVGEIQRQISFWRTKWPALLRRRAPNQIIAPSLLFSPQNRTRPRGKSTNIARIFRKPPDAQ